jgi:hypothetical protein
MEAGQLSSPQRRAKHRNAKQVRQRDSGCGSSLKLILLLVALIALVVFQISGNVPDQKVHALMKRWDRASGSCFS